jgi:hypothetical protein
MHYKGVPVGYPMALRSLKNLGLPIIKVYSIGTPKSENMQNPKPFPTLEFRINDTEIY